MKKNILFIISILVFRLLLDWIYLNEITPYFDYSNLSNYSTSESILSSWIYLALFIPLTLWIIEEKKYGDFSQLIGVYLLFLRIIPFTSLMMYMPQGVGFVVSNFIYWGLILIVLRYMKPKNPFNFLKEGIENTNVINFITIVAVLTVLFVSGYYCHFRIHLSLDDVYDLRLEAREFHMPRILAYLHAATSNIIPILMVYFMMKNKKTIIYLLAFIGLLNFSIAGHKSTLFKIIICLALFYFPKFNIKKILPGLFILLCLLSIAEYLYMGSIAISTIVIRRGLYVPAKLDISYFDYIVEYGPTYFTGGIAFDIGALTGNDDKRCNNGMFSDAFMNLGYLGCIVFPFIFVYFTKIIEFITAKAHDSVKLFTAFVVVMTLASSYFTTSMLTHGLLLLCITLYFMPKSKI